MLTNKGKALVVLNGLVARQLGATSLSGIQHTEDSIWQLNVVGIPDFVPYRDTWEDVARAALDFDIEYTVFEYNNTPKVRLSYMAETATLAVVFRLPEQFQEQPYVIVKQLLSFYLRTRGWEWDTTTPISGYDKLFEDWFGGSA